MTFSLCRERLRFFEAKKPIGTEKKMNNQPVDQFRKFRKSVDRDLHYSVDVIIPALNEETSLPLVLRDLPSVRHVFVVDNGSTDETAVVASQWGAIVVDEPQRGYGAACLRGMDAIQERVRSGEVAPSVVVFLDADYSDHPDYLTSLVEPIFAGEADFVLGSRLLGSRLLGQREPGAMPWQSIFGNKLACWLMHYLFRIRYTDLGPFRAIRYDSLCDLQMSDKNFGWTIEMQIKAARSNLMAKEIPVPYRKRVGVSKISGTIVGSIRAGYKILLTIAKYGFKRGPKPLLRSVGLESEKAHQVVS
jgi:glycosyltransferase involved in cell wall biosynthesis